MRTTTRFTMGELAFQNMPDGHGLRLVIILGIDHSKPLPTYLISWSGDVPAIWVEQMRLRTMNEGMNTLNLPQLEYDNDEEE